MDIKINCEEVLSYPYCSVMKKYVNMNGDCVVEDDMHTGVTGDVEITIIVAPRMGCSLGHADNKQIKEVYDRLDYLLKGYMI